MKKETILIAGLNNFLGFHLALKFYKKFNVIGTISKEIAKYNDLEKFRLLYLKKKINLIKYNVLKSNVHKIIVTYKPNIWIHNISISKNWKKKNFGPDPHTPLASPVSISLWPFLQPGCSH